VPALFGIAVFTLLLLFVGIHNAWDTATYVTVAMQQSPPPTDRAPTAPGGTTEKRA
jgi:hypothetical protein